MNRQNVALSGIAMILIVLSHTIQLGMEYANSLGISIEGIGHYILYFLQTFGPFAVPVFLFISGSFIAYAAKGDPPKMNLKFLRSGLINILIPYLIWSTIFYIFLYLNRGTTTSLGGYVNNLLVGYPFHFVPLLAVFYIISPILVMLGKRFAWLLLFIFLIYQLFLLNNLHPNIFNIALPGWTNYLVIPVLNKTMAVWALCFPIGIVFGLNNAKIRPWLVKFKWVFVILILIFYVLAILNAFEIISAPLAQIICPILFLFVVPLIQRNSIPAVRQFENVGKRSYGVYLTHLVVLDTAYMLLSRFAPGTMHFVVILVPVILVIGLLIPLGVMNYFSKSPLRKYYRYIFG